MSRLTPIRRYPRSRPSGLRPLVLRILSCGLMLTSAVGCGSHQPLDPRKYFSRSDPTETVASFSWSVAARKWEHVSDCLLVEDGAPVPQEVLKELAELEVHTRREASTVSLSPGGDEAAVVVPFQEDFEGPEGRTEFTVFLVSREVVDGFLLWVIDARKTLAANSPLGPVDTESP